MLRDGAWVREGVEGGRTHKPQRSNRVKIRKEPVSKVATEEFYPKGAIAFFATMLGAFALIWLGMYVLLVHRQLGI